MQGRREPLRDHRRELRGGRRSLAVIRFEPLVQPARLELSLLDPQLPRKLWLVAAYLLDELPGVPAPDEHPELDAKREVGREDVVDDGTDPHDCAA